MIDKSCEQCKKIMKGIERLRELSKKAGLSDGFIIPPEFRERAIEHFDLHDEFAGAAGFGLGGTNARTKDIS